MWGIFGFIVAKVMESHDHTRFGAWLVVVSVLASISTIGSIVLLYGETAGILGVVRFPLYDVVVISSVLFMAVVSTYYIVIGLALYKTR
jgi:hypothetical protein